MLLSTRLIFLAAISFIVMFLSGCSEPPATQNVAAPPPTNEPPEFPFSVTEPEVFQAEIVVSGEGIERKMFVARDRGKYRVDYDADSAGQRSVIRGDVNRLVSYRERIYTEEANVRGDLVGTDDPDVELLLGRRVHADLERNGGENGLERYEGNLEGDSRVVVWFDPVVKMVVKEELYRGGKDGPVVSTELRNVKLEVSPDLFEPPTGFRLVTAEEFQKRIRK